MEKMVSQKQNLEKYDEEKNNSIVFAFDNHSFARC